MTGWIVLAALIVLLLLQLLRLRAVRKRAFAPPGDLPEIPASAPPQGLDF